LTSETIVKLLSQTKSCEVACRLARVQVLLIEQDTATRFKKTGFDMILDMNKLISAALDAPSKHRAQQLNEPIVGLAMQFTYRFCSD
jgi:hypothetical protein